MSKNKPIPGLSENLVDYCEDRKLDFHQYSPYHMRIMDGGYVVLDVWTTGRYFVLMTDYLEMLGSTVMINQAIHERGGEKGQLPADIAEFLDIMFFGQSTSQD